MKNIIVTTDFTESSRNALDYACKLVGNDSEYALEVLHIFVIPVTYATDGVAMATIKDALETAEDSLADELEWVKATHPAVKLSGRVVTGDGFTETMKLVLHGSKPEMVVMGAVSDYSELWTWDNELLTALTDLDVPVLIIPMQITFSPIRNIGFACDHRNKCAQRHVDFIKQLADYTGAQLHVVHVTRSATDDAELKKNNEAQLHELLQDQQPQYYTIQDPDIIEAVTKFIKDKQLDMLIVVPHKHDIWYSIFHQSHTRQLARLNHLPVLALHD